MRSYAVSRRRGLVGCSPEFYGEDSPDRSMFRLLVRHGRFASMRMRLAVAW